MTPQRFARAQEELQAIKSKLRNPGSLTVGEASFIGFLALDGLLFFFAGEVVGRGNLVGYKA